MKQLTLNNGIKIPIFGFGTYEISPDQTKQAVLSAFEEGYRLIDTAQYYQNEQQVGEAVKASGLNRDEVFITTKTMTDGYEDTKIDLDESLRRSGLDYFDLVLIHWPMGHDIDTWHALEAAYKAGKTRAIGISNFNSRQTLDLIQQSSVRPMVDQIETHCYDAFKQGKVLPVFDPKKGGGALMDLNIYNIHFLVGLFGMPKKVEYHANIERGVDTSGILTLDYGNFKAVSIAAKDVAAPVTSLIEAEKETIIVNGPANVMNSFDIVDQQNKIQHVDDKIYTHRMYEEFVAFEKMIDNTDLDKDKKALEHSDQVMQIVEQAVKSAGLKLD